MNRLSSFFIFNRIILFNVSSPLFVLYLTSWSFNFQKNPTRQWLQQLIHNIGVIQVPTLQRGEGLDHMPVN